VTRGVVRPIAIAVLRRGASILVSEGRDRTKRETFYRPLGGGIEFGETAEEALRRELREELGVELASVRLLGVLENLFRFEGSPGHEIVFVFDAVVADPGFYSSDPPLLVLDEGSRVSWEPVRRFTNGSARLYPQGMEPFLEID